MTIRLRGKTWNHERGLAPLIASTKMYEKLHPDVEVVWEAHSLQDFASFSIVELAARYDLMVLDHPHLGAATEAGALVALDTIASRQQLAELAACSVGPSYDSYFLHGHLWALPIDAAAQVAAFRPDLVDEDDVPRSWKQVEEMARRGLVLWPLKPIDALCSFFTLAANRGTPCVDGSGHFIAEPDAVVVLEAMADVAAHVPAECHDWDPIFALDALASQDSAAYIPLTFGYSNYSRSTGPGEPLRFANLPSLGNQGPVGSLLGGAGLAVSARSENRDHAVQYALWLASAEVQRTSYVVNGGQPGNSVAWEDEEANRLTDDFFRRTRRTLDASWLRPRAAGFIDFQDAAGQVVSDYLQGRGPATRTAQILRGLHDDLVLGHSDARTG